MKMQIAELIMIGYMDPITHFLGTTWIACFTEHHSELLLFFQAPSYRLVMLHIGPLFVVPAGGRKAEESDPPAFDQALHWAAPPPWPLLSDRA